MLAQQKMKRLEQENNTYKQRLLELTCFNSIKQDLDHYLKKHNIKSILEIRGDSSNTDKINNNNNGQINGTVKELLDLHSETTNGNGKYKKNMFIFFH